MLFVSAKVTHFGLLPQGKPENDRRVLNMVRQMDKEGFGNCSNYFACEAVCPAGIPASVIAHMNRGFSFASIKESIGVSI
jgi:succinate dehydrogenase / fumarate reductase iron-sulfur subunit